MTRTDLFTFDKNTKVIIAKNMNNHIFLLVKSNKPLE